MVDSKMCRICMAKENLTSLFCQMDGGKISEKIFFVCGIAISSTDAYPKFICHQCLSSIIIASSIKKKSLETEKIFQDMLSEDAEYIEDKDSDEESDPFLVERKNPMNNRFLVYEENPKIDQPKMNYNLSETSVKINSLSHFNYNPELKAFVQNYLQNKPNLEIVKISDASCIKEIERVLSINEDAEAHGKRVKIDRQTISFETGASSPRFGPRQKTTTAQPSSSSRLLNALSGQRLENTAVNRSSSPNINTSNRRNAMFRK